MLRLLHRAVTSETYLRASELGHTGRRKSTGEGKNRRSAGKSNVFVVEIGNDCGRRARWLVKVFDTECVECVDSYRV